MEVRAFIVEDEPLARRTLRDFSAELEWLQVIGEAADGASAVQLIDALRPDLVFLDVQIPEMSGLEVLKRIRHDPAVVFTTAFDHHAVAAFELQALDYLLKPFGRERFRRAAERARQHLGAAAAGEQTVRERARQADEPASGPLTRLFVRDGGRIVPVRMDDVTRLEASDEYVQVVTGGRAYLVAVPLSEIEKRLDPLRFQRVHRSHIINVDHIASMQSFDARRLLIRMNDGSEVLASRSGSQHLQHLVL